MKKTITRIMSLAAGLCMLSNLNAQCTLTASVIATPVTTPGLSYYLDGSVTGGTAYYGQISILETGDSYQYTNNVGYAFPASGNYTVCYYATDSTQSIGCSDSACIVVTVNGNGATNCTGTITGGSNGSGSYSFWPTLNAAPAWNTTCSWDFGDGTTGVSSSGGTSHTYAANGLMECT
jgi:hypothetical protein